MAVQAFTHRLTVNQDVARMQSQRTGEEDEEEEKERKCERFLGGRAIVHRARNAGESGIVIFPIRAMLTGVVTTIRKRK